MLVLNTEESAVMDVIKKGKLPEDNVYLGSCHHCGTVVKFMRSEGELVFDQRDGDYIEIECPLCHTSICVNL